MFITKELLTDIALQAGVKEIGAVSADPLLDMKERLERRRSENRITTFEEQNLSARLSPEGLMDKCRSIITLAVPYTPPDSQSSPKESNLYGKVARCARSIDYHFIIEKKAVDLIDSLKKIAKINFKYRILADRSPLLERELARKSGQGLIGENCTLINSRYGSYTALATILLDKEVESGPANNEKCLSCGRCRKACPTGALVEPYIINPHRCISYLTQIGGPIPLEMRPLMGRHIYGCDLCQEACPLNKHVQLSPYPESAFIFFPAHPLLIPILQMTRREYELTVGFSSAGWRGKTILQRNAVIALGNINDPDTVKPLSRLLEDDSRPLIRQHAAWALGRIGGNKAVFSLEKSRLKDPEENVKIEAEQALTDRT